MTENDTQAGDPVMRIIKRREGADLEFQGVVTAEVSSKVHYRDRWTELRLYTTVGGNLICEEVGCSRVAKEVDLTEAVVCESERDVIKFFGDGWLAKKLYDIAGIVAKTHVA